MSNPTVWNNVYGQVKLTDGTGSPIVLTCGFDKGDLSIDGLKSILNEDVDIEARGRHIGTLPGARIRPSISLSSFVSSYAAEIMAFVTKTGAYAANVSTCGANDPMYHFDIELTLRKSLAGGADEVIKATNCTASGSLNEAQDGNTFSVQLSCKGSIFLDGDELAQVAG